ncbi:MAG: glycerol-3-phosphate dehydrogenase C-terminal domain-containing protein, partial [Pseudomonadota bacterium]
RIVFVNPYFDDLALIGTTDVPYEDRPEDVAITPQEAQYLVDILNRYFRLTLTVDDVVADYSGVRALFDDDSDKGASAVTRDYAFELDGDDGRAPILSAFGGKITTYRKLAEAALHKLGPTFPAMGGDWTSTAPLPGGDIPDADINAWRDAFHTRHSFLPAALADHYARCYGTDADTLLAGAEKLAHLGRHFGGLLYEREAAWLVSKEWARAADDILLRRTKHGLFLSDVERSQFADWFGQSVAA